MTAAGACPPQEPQGGGAFAALEWPGDVRDLPTAGSTVAYAIVLAVAVLLVVAAFAARRRRSRPPVAGIEAPGPQATALAQLRALVVPDEAAGVDAFYLAVKAVLRLHAHERFAVRAFVATSEELRQRVPHHGDLDGALHACDGVLFGAVRPDAAAHRKVLALAEAWLDAGAGGAA